MKKIIFTLFSFLFTAHIIFSAQQNSEQSAQQERQSTVNQASRSQARQMQEQNKQDVYKKIEKTSKRLKLLAKMGVNSELRTKLFEAAKILRTSAHSFRNDNFSEAENLCAKANEILDTIPDLFKQHTDKVNEYNKILEKAKKLISILHRRNLSDDLRSKLNRSIQFVRYAEQYASNEDLNKAILNAKKSIEQIGNIEIENTELKRQQESNEQLTIKSNNLSLKCNSLLGKTEQIVTQGEIRKNFMKARGHYLRGMHFFRIKKIFESIEEYNKSIDILEKIPNQIQENNKKKEIAFKALQEAEKYFSLISRKRLNDEDISNFTKARKLFFSARNLYQENRFDESKKQADEAITILKVL